MNISHSSASKGSGTIHTAHPSHGWLVRQTGTRLIPTVDKLELELIGIVTFCQTMKQILVILLLQKAAEQFIQLIQIMDG
jgi:hypothetical protein